MWPYRYVSYCYILLLLTMCLLLIVGPRPGLAQDYGDLGDNDDDDEDDIDDDGLNNSTELGQYVGSHCEHVCNPKLVHVFCDPITTRCECERKYPVRLGPHKGCAKPVNLGDQCFYYKTCNFADQHAECVQIKHNAICQCKHGYHTVTLQRPNKRTFCSPDLLVVTTDIPTLLGVATGLAIFTALICFVLKLFVGAKPRHYANANLAPPILFASDTGIPLSVHNIRSASRASSDRGGVGGSAAVPGPNYLQKGSRGVLVPASRAGAARAAAILLISCHLTPEQTQQGSNAVSLASVHSSASSTKSYSQRRYEKEIEQKLIAQRNKETATPSPRSTDHLLSESQLESDEAWTTKSGGTLDDGTGSGIPIAQGGRSHSEGDSSASSFPVVSSSLPTTLQCSTGRGIIGPCSSVDWSQDTDAS